MDKQKSEEKNKRKGKPLKKRTKAAKTTGLRGKEVGLEGFCETSPVLIGELINGAIARTCKKPVPCDCTAVYAAERDTYLLIQP